jgi:hypothetical protein
MSQSIDKNDFKKTAYSGQNLNSALQFQFEMEKKVEGARTYEILQEEYESSNYNSNSPEENKNKNLCPNLKKHYIGHVKEAHQFTLDNEFIVHGYRINFHSCNKILNSLCMCHNETVNVWTHLVGALFTFLLIVVTFSMVGAYGERLNSLQQKEENRNKVHYEKFKDPFFSSKAYLHNTLINLSTMKMIIKKLDQIEDLENEVIQNWQIKLRISLDYLKKDQEIIKSIQFSNFKCDSCIEDYRKKINANEELVDYFINYSLKIKGNEQIRILLLGLKEKIKEINEYLEKNVKIIFKFSIFRENWKI